MTTHAKLELNGPMETGFDEVLTPDALEFVAELEHRFGPRRRELLEARSRRRERLRAGEMLDFLPDTREIREGDWTVAPVGRRHAAALGRDHRPDRSQDDDQRAELGRRRVHGRLRGRQRADLAQHGRRAPQPQRRDRRDDHLPRLRGQGLPAGREPGHAARPPARLAPPRAPPAGRLEPGHGRAVRLRPVRLPLRAPRCCGAAPAPYFYLPKMEIAPRGAAVERRVRVRPGVRWRSRAGRSRPPC